MKYGREVDPIPSIVLLQISAITWIIGEGDGRPGVGIHGVLITAGVVDHILGPVALGVHIRIELLHVPPARSPPDALEFRAPPLHAGPPLAPPPPAPAYSLLARAAASHARLPRLR